MPSSFYLWRSLGGRIALLLVGLTLALGAISLVRATLDLTTILRTQLENRAVAIAKDLGRNSANPALADDVFALYELVNSSLVNNEDVRYVLIVESSGEIRIHTFGKSLSEGLRTANSLPAGVDQEIRTLDTDEGSILDVAVRAPDGRVVRVGMTLGRVRQEVLSYIEHLAALMAIPLLAAVAISAYLSSWLMRPLKRLGQAAAAVGRGELGTKVLVEGGTEIGGVAKAFNAMTEALDGAQQEVLARNSDLETLYSMARDLGQLQTTEQVVETSLRRVLTLPGARAGWICLLDEERGLRPAAYSEASTEEVSTEVGVCDSPCQCMTAIAGVASDVVAGLPACPIAQRLASRGGPGPGDVQHVVVRLAAHEEVLGALVLVCEGSERLGERRVPLLASLGHQIGIALRNAYLHEAVQREGAARHLLIEKLIRAQEEERRRVAREIHDEPAQALSGLLMRLDKMEQRYLSTGQYHTGELEQARQTLRQALEVLHQITVDLRPSALDDLGFLPAIRWYSDQRLSEHDVQLDFEVKGPVRRLDPYAEVAIFRVTQEAVTNIIKHARAKHVRMIFGFDGRSLTGRIEDDGRGFEAARANASRGGGGLGVLGMEERVSLLGGRLTASSRRGNGTTVAFEVPLADGGEDAGSSAKQDPGNHR